MLPKRILQYYDVTSLGILLLILGIRKIHYAVTGDISVFSVLCIFAIYLMMRRRYLSYMGRYGLYVPTLISLQQCAVVIYFLFNLATDLIIYRTDCVTYFANLI